MSRISATEGEFTVREVGGRLYASWRCQDGRTFDLVKRAFREYFPQWTAVRYDGQWHAWALPLHHHQRLATWAGVWFTNAAQHWDEDSDEGTASWDRRERGEAPAAPVSILDRAYAALHLLPTAPPALVQAAHHLAIKATHPDAGGTHQGAVTVNAAIATIRDHQQDDCHTEPHSRRREKAES